MDHAGYVGALLGVAYVRLHQLLTEEGIEPMPVPIRSPALAPGDPQVQQSAVWMPTAVAACSRLTASALLATSR